MKVEKMEVSVVEFEELRAFAEKTYNREFPEEMFEDEHGGIIADQLNDVTGVLEKYDSLDHSGPGMIGTILAFLCHDGHIVPGQYVVRGRDT